ncbi:MAG: permease [Gammaproteobacteria bacterium]|nr:MAG: permease [Gammaproteobacteria bacterium]
MENLLSNIWAVYLDTAFWLLLGLLAAGFVKAFIPEQAMQRWLGGSGIGAIGRAALFGAPLPLCSCGVLPAAISLRRNGASKEATVSFLISTPETSIDSVTVTYALMGPVMAIYRPFAALMSAIVTGLMTTLVKDEKVALPVLETVGCCSTQSSCCAPKTESLITDCCSGTSEVSSCCDAKSDKEQTKWQRAIRFAGAELLDDISTWLFVGIVVAGIMFTLIPEGWLAQWGQGLPAMLVMLLVGIPMYICAVASTPIAAGLILAGVSPGTVLVFLLVGPATNIASVMLVRKELGPKVTLVYLLGLSLTSIALGLLLDWALIRFGWQVVVEMGMAHRLLPDVLSYGSALLLLLLVIPAVRNRLFPFFR